LIVLSAAVSTVHAATVDWMGFTWTLRGDTVATVNLDGSLTLTGTATKSGDEGYDNWVATTALSNVQQMTFGFIDQGGNGQGARAYASSGSFNGSGELLLQGGVYATFGNYWTNYSAWVSSGWKDTTWANPGNRLQGEHSVTMANCTDGRTRIFFDGVQAIVSGSPDPSKAVYYEPTKFTRAYLGASIYPTDSTGNLNTFSVTYTRFNV
jgi:hypothetical protein